MTQADARRAEAVILATIVLFGLLSVVAFRALLPLAAVSTAALLWLLRDTGVIRETLRSPVLWGLGAVAAAGALSWFVSVDRGQTGPKILQLSAIILVGGLMISAFRKAAPAINPDRLRLACFASVGLCALGVLMVIFTPALLADFGVPERYLNAGPDNLANRAAILLAIWIFLAAALPGRAAPGVLIGGAAVLLATDQLSQGVDAPLAAIVAVGGGGATMALAFLFGRKAIKIIGALGVVVLLAAPWATLNVGGFALDRLATLTQTHPPQDILTRLVDDANANHRIVIWTSTAERSLERPWLGWGLDVSRRVPASRDTSFGQAGAPIALHPHNGALQIWLELGVVGAIAAAFALVLVTGAIARASPDPRFTVHAAGAIGATAVIILVSFGVFQSWWIGALLMLAAFAQPIAQVRRASISAEPRK